MNDKDRLLRIHATLIECDTLYGELWSTKLNKDSIELNDDGDKHLVFAFKPYRDSQRCCIVEVQGFHGDRRIVQRHFRSFNGRKALIPLKPAIIHKFVRTVNDAQRFTPEEVRARFRHYKRLGVLRLGPRRYLLIFDGRWRLLSLNENVMTFEFADQLARYIRRFKHQSTKTGSSNRRQY